MPYRALGCVLPFADAEIAFVDTVSEETTVVAELLKRPDITALYRATTNPGVETQEAPRHPSSTAVPAPKAWSQPPDHGPALVTNEKQGRIAAGRALTLLLSR